MTGRKGEKIKGVENQRQKREIRGETVLRGEDSGPGLPTEE